MTTDLTVFDEVTAEMAEYKKENESLVFDYEDPQGNKDARRHIYKLRQAKTKIADIHKVAKAEALGVCRMLDGKKNTLTADVNEMIDVHYKPVKEIEEREVKKAAVKANEERLERIRVEAERVAENERREEEIAAKEKALQDKEDALAREAEKLEAAKQAEIDKQAAVKAAQEAASRERQLVTEAAEHDKKETAAKAEQDKKDALAKAEREKQAAIDAEKEKARQAEADLQVKIRAEKVEKQRLAEIERSRVENEQHRTTIENDIKAWFSDCIGEGGADPDDIVYAILGALIDNEIPHVTILY